MFSIRVCAYVLNSAAAEAARRAHPPLGRGAGTLMPALAVSTVSTLMSQNSRRSSPCRAEQLFLPSPRLS